MKIVDISVKRPIGIVMIMIAILLMGTISLNNLAIDLYPKLNLPIAVVVTEYDGAAPQEVEKIITRTLEGSLGTIEGIKTLQSTSSPNQSLIMIRFDWGSNMDTKINSIRDKLDLVTNFLPEGASKPLVLRVDPTQMPIMRLAVSGEVDEAELSQIAEEVIKPRLERTVGVANVSLLGSKRKEVKVEVNPIYLTGYGLTIHQISQALAGENLSATAGTLRRGNQELQLRITGEYENLEQIENTIIRLPRGGTVRLKEIATVREEYKRVTEITKASGKPSLSFDIQKKSDGNTIKVSDELYRSIEDINVLLPDEIKVEVVYDLSIFIRQSVDNVLRNLMIGGVLATLILFLFLKSVRSTLVIGITMPFAVITTFNLIYFNGETLNLLTLGGLALGIGMMVDSAIVILENIFRYNEQGYSRIEAAKEGAKEVGPAVIASALTTIAVFLPIVYVEGLAAEIFRPLALTVTFSLLSSLIASITLVPMLAAYLLTNKKDNSKKGIKKLFKNLLESFEKRMDRVYSLYHRLLKGALNRRKTVVIITGMAIIASFSLIPLIGTEFIPAMDQGEINIDVRLPEGTLLEETDKTVADIESRLIAIKEIKSIFTSAGSGGAFSMGLANSNIGNLYVRLITLSERNRSTNQVMEEIRSLTGNIPGADIKVSQIQSGGFGNETPISIKITGDDFTVLNQIAERVQQEVEQVEGTRNVTSSTERGRPEMQIIVDRDKAAYYSLSYGQILSTVRTGFNGQIATRYRSSGHEYDVRVTLPEEYKKDLNQVKEIQLLTPFGVQIPLKEVAELIEVKGPAKINREDQKRQVKVNSDLVDRDLGSVIKDIQQKLDNIHLPSGYQIQISGQYQDMMESFDSMYFALILAIFLVYMVMAVQFEALTYPFIIMFSMPATFIGIVIGLVITGRPLSIPAFIGIIMLAGIVVNNAIVLVDYINLLRQKGMDRVEAILQAGPNRLRPILMTTLTTILGLIPLTLGIGEGAETQASLATVVVFGLSFSTIVTLVLIPIIYTYIDDFEKWIKGFFEHVQKNKSNLR